MVGEKSCAHQCKLKGSVVGGGVMDGNASVGDSHKGPLKNRGEIHLLSQKTKHK
jgi:hypothetical protein